MAGANTYQDVVFDSLPMVQKQIELAEDIRDVASRVGRVEDQIQILLTGQQHMIRTLTKVAKITDTRKSNKKRNAHRRPPRRCPNQTTAQDLSRLLLLPLALQKCIKTFTEQMSVKGTLVTDLLTEKECLSDDECEVIRLKPSHKDQARSIVRKIKDRGPENIIKFLDIVGEINPEIPKTVYDTLDVLVEEHKDKPKCVMCFMKQTVDLRDIGDKLWSEGVISDDIHADIFESDLTYSNKQIHWEYITNFMNNTDEFYKTFDILKSALEDKYQHIAKFLNADDPEQLSLSCLCRNPRRVKSRNLSSDTRSQTEYSTTSSRIPNIIKERDDLVSESSLRSTELKSLSFDPLEQFEDISSFPVQEPQISSTTDPEGEQRTRHTSGTFVPTKHHHDDNEHDILADADTEKKYERQDTYQESPDVCQSTARFSSSSGYISSASSKPSDHHSSDQTPSPQLHTKMTYPLIKMEHHEEESAKETDAGDEGDNDRTRQKKCYRKRTSSNEQTANLTAATPPGRPCQPESRLQAQKKRQNLKNLHVFVKTKSRSALNSLVANIGLRRQNSRKSKRSNKRALRRQKSRTMDENFTTSQDNVRDTSESLKKPFNPLWRKSDLYNKTYLQPELKPRWDYYQARRHNRLAHLAAQRKHVTDSDSDFVTEECETVTCYSSKT